MNTQTNEVSKQDVILFMEGTLQAPQCGFSYQVAQLPAYSKVNFDGVNVLEDDNIRKSIKQYGDWLTILQLYIKGEFIGGCDIFREKFGGNKERVKPHPRQKPKLVKTDPPEPPEADL